TLAWASRARMASGFSSPLSNSKEKVVMARRAASAPSAWALGVVPTDSYWVAAPVSASQLASPAVSPPEDAQPAATARARARADSLPNFSISISELQQSGMKDLAAPPLPISGTGTRKARAPDLGR